MIEHNTKKDDPQDEVMDDLLSQSLSPVDAAFLNGSTIVKEMVWNEVNVAAAERAEEMCLDVPEDVCLEVKGGDKLGVSTDFAKMLGANTFRDMVDRMTSFRRGGIFFMLCPSSDPDDYPFCCAYVYNAPDTSEDEARGWRTQAENLCSKEFKCLQETTIDCLLTKQDAVATQWFAMLMGKVSALQEERLRRAGRTKAYVQELRLAGTPLVKEYDAWAGVYVSTRVL